MMCGCFDVGCCIGVVDMWYYYAVKWQQRAHMGRQHTAMTCHSLWSAENFEAKSLECDLVNLQQGMAGDFEEAAGDGCCIGVVVVDGGADNWWLLW